MGKAMIVSHTGEGQYKAKLQPDRTAYDRHHARLVENIAKVDGLLAALAPQIDAAESAESAAWQLLQNGIVNQSDQLKEYEADWLKKNNTLKGLQQTKSRLTLQKAALQLRLDELEKSEPKDAEEVDLWCADYSEDLTGEVGTIEPAGDSSLGVILRPGQRTPAWNPQGDGTLRDPRHMSAAEVFWNAALLPGWQKWTPTYRIGTITALNGDSCDVTLEVVQSEAQGIPVNQFGELKNVGIDYMDCHGAAFEVGDTVVVMFEGREWGNPQVIGFEKQPRECATRGFLLHNNTPGNNGYPYYWSNDLWLLKRSSSSWSAALPTELLAGNVDWQGYAGTLSWDGPPSRYWPVTNEQMTNIFYPFDVPYAPNDREWAPPPGTHRLLVGTWFDWSGRRKIFRSGKSIASVYLDATGGMVTSATLSPDGRRCMVTVLEGWSTARRQHELPEKVYFFDVGSSEKTMADMRLKATFTSYQYAAEFDPLTSIEVANNLAPYMTRVWRFNASGTIGVTERYGTRQTMTVDWENETVSVVAGIAAQISVVDELSDKYIYWVGDGAIADLPDYWFYNEVTLLAEKSDDRHIRFGDFRGDIFIEGEISILTEYSNAWGWLDDERPGLYPNHVRTDELQLQIDGAVFFAQSIGLTSDQGVATRGESFALFLHGLDLRSGSASIDIMTHPAKTITGSGASGIVTELSPATLENRTMISSLTTATPGNGNGYDVTIVPLGRSEFDPTIYILKSDHQKPVAGVTRLAAQRISLALLSRDDRFSPHNGQGVCGGKIASRFEYGTTPTVQVLAEIQKFPCLKNFTYSTGEMLRFAHNVPSELIPETKNWAQLAVL